MSILGTVTTVLTALSFAATAAASCGGVVKPSEIEDRALLWRNGVGWKPIIELNEHLRKGATKKIDFLYVAKETKSEDQRRGVIVVKSGFAKPDGTTPEDFNSVRLYRPRIKDSCNKHPYKEFHGKVTLHNYDDYHDRSKDTRQVDVFSKFHIYYSATTRCRDTNDDTPDGMLDWRALSNRSNRSQFSFNPQVVRQGQKRSLFTWLGIRSAYADELVAGRTAQIFTYATDRRGLACVRFQVDVGPGAFLLVNDLEKRTLLGGDGAKWERDE